MAPRDAPRAAAAPWPAAPVLRRWLGAVIALAGAWLLAAEAYERFASGDARLTGALAGGLMAAGATALGTLPVLLSQRISQRTSDAMLGFGAGIMLAASAFSLVIPALRAAHQQGHGPWGSGSIVGGGIVLGAAFLLAAARWAPDVPTAYGLDGAHAKALKRAWLFVLAISLHNMPEGLAIGVGFAGGDAAPARALATGISIQDVPEGLVVALALRGVGYGRLLSVALGIASGLVEPVASVAGAAAIGVSAGLLPWGLAFAAGAMLFAISHEVIPGAHQQGNDAWATSSLILGFVLMMLLDTALG